MVAFQCSVSCFIDCYTPLILAISETLCVRLWMMDVFNSVWMPLTFAESSDEGQTSGTPCENAFKQNHLESPVLIILLGITYKSNGFSTLKWLKCTKKTTLVVLSYCICYLDGHLSFCCAFLCVSVHTLYVCVFVVVSYQAGDLWPTSKILITFYFSLSARTAKNTP